MGALQERYDWLVAASPAERAQEARRSGANIGDLTDKEAALEIISTERKGDVRWHIEEGDVVFDKPDSGNVLEIHKTGDEGKTKFGVIEHKDNSVTWRFPQEVATQTEFSHWLTMVGLPAFLDHLLYKNQDYGDEHLSGRGPAGEFIGIERKVGKLGKAVWEGQELNHEQPPEILRDLIGSCFLMLHQLHVGYTGGYRAGKENPRTE